MTQPPQLPLFVAIGSNVGDSRQHVRRAFAALQVRFPGEHRVSSLYATAPVACPPGSPDYVNAVVMIERLDAASPPEPMDLLSGLLMLERSFGRLERRVRNEPRILDLDVVAMGQLQGQFDALTLPHPRAHLRAFVLAPLAELAPDFVLPGQTSTATELLATVDVGGCRRLPL